MTELPITDARMTRFSITLEQGVEFVLHSFDRMLGGELFVPKIPSLRIVDLARVLAPELPQKIVGIRPGEKLHELMCPVDEAHQTLEFSDHYVIQPSIRFNAPDSYIKNAVGETGGPVPEGFQYSSDNNDHWLEGQALQKMIQAVADEA